MAIAAGNAGTWAAVNATTQTVTLPTHAAGTQLILVAACKSATPANLNIQVTTPSTGWEKIGSFADGTTGSGNGTGSVTCAVFRRIAASSSETNPVVTWGGSETAAPGIAVAVGFTKGGSEVWLIPALVQAATNNATAISVTMGSNPGITAGDFGLGFHTTRDDSALTVPTWTATGATLAAVTVFPGTPIASGTSNDMAGTGCYRSVTSGTASAAPVVTGTQAAAETGVTSFIRLRVAAESPQAPTPASPTALGLTTFAPTVTVLSPVLVTPTTATLTTTRFVPQLRETLTPATKALALATFAPVVRLGIIPPARSLALATFAPTIGLRIIPPATAVALSTFAPTVSVESNDVLVTPGSASIALATFAPTVTATQNQRVVPSAASLTTATFAPTIALPVLATPTTKALAITALAPSVGQPVQVTPTTRAVVLAMFAPTVTTSNHQQVVPSTASVTTTRFAPTVLAPALVVPSTKALTLATFTPTIAAGVRAIPATAALASSTLAPVVTTTNHALARPDVVALLLGELAPTVTATAHVLATPATRALLLAGMAPAVHIEGGVGPDAVMILATAHPPVTIAGSTAAPTIAADRSAP